MRHLLLAALAVAVVALPAASLAQNAERGPVPVPIEEWSPDKVIALGREIYVQDIAAWVGTDALLAALTEAEEATIRGWVVLGDGATRTVRFLKADGDGVAPGWDVKVANGQAAPPVPATDTAMTGETLVRFQALQTAIANMGTLRCGRYNSVVARDPDSDDWLVWLLASTGEAGVVPIGGHYRFHISADGQTVVRRDQLSNGCMSMRAPQKADPNGPQLMFVTQLVSAGPVETHVFLSMQNRVPIYVAAGDRVFAVEGDRIEDVTDAMR